MPEMKIIEWFQLHRIPALDALMVVVSFLSSGYVIVLVAGGIAVYLLYRHRRRDAFIIFGGTSVGAALELIIKPVFGRERPLLPHQLSGYSFPSGHVLIITVLIGLLMWLGSRQKSRRRALYYSLAGMALVVVGLNRVYLGVHWPSDVLGGYVFGLIIVGSWFAFIREIWPIPGRKSRREN